MKAWRRKDPTDIKLLESLGEGLTSQVHKAIRKHADWEVEQTVAVKIFKSRKADHTLKNEIQILSKVESTHCVRLLGWADFKRGPAILLEYLEGVSLFDLCAYERLQDSLIYEVIAQLQTGLGDLHSHQVIHGDLSAKNIFVTNRGVVKILDFGFSAFKTDQLSHGTPQFLSIEAWRGEAITDKSDLFSLGLLMHDLLGDQLHQNKSKEAFKSRAIEMAGKNALLDGEPAARRFLTLKSLPETREELAAVVRKAAAKKRSSSSTTRWIGDLPIVKKSGRPAFSFLNNRGVWPAVGVFALLLLFFHQLQPVSLPRAQALAADIYKGQKHSLDIRSPFWAQVQLVPKRGPFWISGNEHTPAYTPFRFKNLPEGDYELHWRSEGRSGIILVQLDRSQRILIK